jgi:hypothetical protein
MGEREMTPKVERRERAVRKVARALHIDLEMDHADGEHTVTIRDLRRALEEAYDAGVAAGLS